VTVQSSSGRQDKDIILGTDCAEELAEWEEALRKHLQFMAARS
jgi:hypothetical protein